jgi:hypothetical protein
MKGRLVVLVIVGVILFFDIYVNAEKDNLMEGMKVRLFLIRHSETQANKDGIVLGQSDSVRTFSFFGLFSSR